MLLAFIRLIFFPLTTLIAAVTGLLFRVIGLPHRLVYGVFNLWSKTQHLILNVKVETYGNVPENGAIIMANHRSYLDIVMIPSKTPVVFVAKASVRKWPVVGWGGDAMRTLWVERSSPESRKKTRNAIMDRLNDNLSVIIFPEGTTSVGPGVLDFKPGMFHAVAGTGLEIIPVAIEYENPNIAWVGQDTFIPHFLREFGAWQTRVKVAFGEPISGDDGEQLREKVQTWIEQHCLQFREMFDEKR